MYCSYLVGSEEHIPVARLTVPIIMEDSEDNKLVYAYENRDN